MVLGASWHLLWYNVSYWLVIWLLAPWSVNPKPALFGFDLGNKPAAGTWVVLRILTDCGSSKAPWRGHSLRVTHELSYCKTPINAGTVDNTWLTTLSMLSALDCRCLLPPPSFLFYWFGVYGTKWVYSEWGQNSFNELRVPEISVHDGKTVPACRRGISAVQSHQPMSQL